MNVLKFLFWVLIINGNVFTLTYRTNAQSIPQVPYDVDFAGVTVHLNEQGRAKLRREVGRLYINRTETQRDIESLRQLTPLLEPLLKAGRFPMDYRYAVLPFADAEPTRDESTGYWGLTSTRARHLNMVMSNTIDERFHPIVATKRATAQLSRLHATANNYVLTLLRYMQDDTLTDRLTDGANSTYLLLDVQSPPLIWKSLARKLVFEREEPTLRITQPYLLYNYQYGSGYSLRTISQQLRLDEERLKPFNTWLKSGVIPDEKDYSVLVRVTTDEFLTIQSRSELRWKPSVVTQIDVGFPMLTKLARSKSPTYESAVFYTINERLGVQAQPCDNVITLAHYGRIAIKTLLSYNELSGQDVVQPGQIYYLERKAKRAKVPFHIVQKNQTLREIANVYGVQLKSLLRFNRIQPNQRVKEERVVWLRKKRPRQQPVEYRQVPVNDEKPALADSTFSTSGTPVDSAVSKPAAGPDKKVVTVPETARIQPSTVTNAGQLRDAKSSASSAILEPQKTLKQHVVRPGQTYYRLSQLYGITLNQLYTWNKLSDRIPLRVGQKLIVGMTTKRPPVRPASPAITNSPGLTKPVRSADKSLSKSSERVVYHIVRAGQTVYRVALINRVSVPDLMRWNNLKNYTIEVGQKLLIRKGN